MAVFTAFSDESGAQDPVGPFLVGGYVADVDTWPWLASAWQDRVLNSRPSIPYLHMIEIRRKRWQSEHGLTWLQAEEKVSTAISVIASTGGMSAIHSEISRGDLADALQARGIKRQIGIDEPDYQCFIGYAYHVLREVRYRYPEAERVDFVVSRKGKITDHIKEFHEELKELVKQHNPELGTLVGRLIPDDMDGSPPLQAADVLCWHVRRLYETGVQDTIH